MNRDQKAIRYKQSGCNCCQAVLCAFADQLDIDETILKQLGAAFGMGMGGMEGNCGALIAAQMILGMWGNYLQRFKRFGNRRDAL